MTLLKLEGLTARYGASQALIGVDLEVGAGEVVALMGRNGMGKTTTVKAICRMIPSEGRLSLDGQDLHPLPSHRVARLGIGLVPEGRRCFADLTVRENLIAAARPGDWTQARVTALFPRLGERLTQRAASLFTDALHHSKSGKLVFCRVVSARGSPAKMTASVNCATCTSIRNSMAMAISNTHHMRV